MKVKYISLIVIMVLLALSMGCNLNQMEPEKDALTNDTTAETRYDDNLKNDSTFMRTVMSDYEDIATSSSYMYLLWRNGDASYLDRYAISSTSGSYDSYYSIMLDCIDYVSSTWGVIGADNTNEQIKINCFAASPDYVIDYPADMSDVSCIAGRHISTTQLEVWVTVPAEYYGTYIRRGVYTAGYNYISWDSVGTTRFHGMYENGLSLYNNYLYKNFSYYPSYFERQTSVNGPDVGEDLSPYTSHAYSFDGELTKFNPFAFDFTTYSYDYIYGLDSYSGERHIVRLRISELMF